MSKRKNFPLRIPRYAKGIRSQGTRGGLVAASWWEQRWMGALERMNFLGRLGRARNYALSGQVLSIALKGAHVDARVMGVRTDAYDVTIDFRTPPPKVRRQIVSALRANPMLIARLLANDLPTEVEAIFRETGLDLFPGGKLGEGKYDVTTHCTCPDYANPCKHSLAVLILLGEEIAHRPYRLLELRGIKMEEFHED